MTQKLWAKEILQQNHVKHVITDHPSSTQLGQILSAIGVDTTSPPPPGNQLATPTPPFLPAGNLLTIPAPIFVPAGNPLATRASTLLTARNLLATPAPSLLPAGNQLPTPTPAPPLLYPLKGIQLSESSRHSIP